MNRLSQESLIRSKMELEESYKCVVNFSKIYDFYIQDCDISFFRYVLKKALLFKNISGTTIQKDILNQMVSDLIDLIKYTILQDRRPFYLSLRSFCENSIRLVENNPLSAEHITLNVINSFIGHSDGILTKDDIAFLKSEYRSASTVIHFHNEFNDLHYYLNSLLSKSSKDFGSYNRFFRLYKIIETMLINTHPDMFYYSFIRRLVVLKYLTSDTTFDTLKNNIH